MSRRDDRRITGLQYWALIDDQLVPVPGHRRADGLWPSPKSVPIGGLFALKGGTFMRSLSAPAAPGLARPCFRAVAPSYQLSSPLPAVGLGGTLARILRCFLGRRPALVTVIDTYRIELFHPMAAFAGALKKGAVGWGSRSWRCIVGIEAVLRSSMRTGLPLAVRVGESDC